MAQRVSQNALPLSYVPLPKSFHKAVSWRYKRPVTNWTSRTEPLTPSTNQRLAGLGVRGSLIPRRRQKHDTAVTIRKYHLKVYKSINYFDDHALSQAPPVNVHFCGDGGPLMMSVHYHKPTDKRDFG